MSVDLYMIYSVASICGVIAFYLATKLTQDLLKEPVTRERILTPAYVPSHLEAGSRNMSV